MNKFYVGLGILLVASMFLFVGVSDIGQNNMITSHSIGVDISKYDCSWEQSNCGILINDLGSK